MKRLESLPVNDETSGFARAAIRKQSLFDGIVKRMTKDLNRQEKNPTHKVFQMTDSMLDNSYLQADFESPEDQLKEL